MFTSMSSLYFHPIPYPGVSSPTTAKGRGVVDSSSGRGEINPSFRPVLPWDEDVPAYDGTMSFNPKTYRALKRLNSFEIQPDSAILVMFTP